MSLTTGVSVTGTHVFDRLSQHENKSAGASPDEGVLPRLAEQMVTSSILSGRMLRELRYRLFPTTLAPEAVAVAQTLRAEFQQWVEDAESAYARARQLETSGRRVPGTGELGDMIGATMAMLEVSIEDFPLQRMGPSEAVSIEELRRELQLKRGA